LSRQFLPLFERLLMKIAAGAHDHRRFSDNLENMNIVRCSSLRVEFGTIAIEWRNQSSKAVHACESQNLSAPTLVKMLFQHFLRLHCLCEWRGVQKVDYALQDWRLIWVFDFWLIWGVCLEQAVFPTLNFKARLGFWEFVFEFGGLDFELNQQLFLIG
jgi:hypothetical protein